MRARVVIGSIGSILKFFSFSFLIPIIVSYYFNEEIVFLFSYPVPFTSLVFFLCFAFTLVIGIIFEFLGSTVDFTDKEGFAIVSVGWMVIAFFACLPFLFTGSMSSFPDAFFEAMSGLTTTGATVLSYPLENHLQSVLFWRGLLQWMGGMGIIVLSVAVLTRLTSGGQKLIESEAPGPSLHKLKPTITQTAKLLWLVYVFFTV
ncbi:MAG: potassium transporter TrkG, partial [Candidatus Thermoplasmatota archaeon]